MQTIQYTTVDKSEWGPGPWQDECDKVQWQDEATGLPCLAKRQPSLGHWCGYVGVPKSHPLHGRGYDALYGNGHNIDVHGGLTYADACQQGDESETICHIPGDGEDDDVWWFGFDCAHRGDLSPYMRRHHPDLHGFDETYRTLDYVQDQCRDLARQLAAIG